ncbi:unnamed protein product [Fusarium graminearum]|nr:unnamed protein product [Fusarium graminearum]
MAHPYHASTQGNSPTSNSCSHGSPEDSTLEPRLRWTQLVDLPLASWAVIHGVVARAPRLPAEGGYIHHIMR